MDPEQFREFGKAAVDYLADYFETIRDRPVLPSVQPGYLQQLVPEEAPQTGEKWQDIIKDMDRVIMPGVTHWHSPHFHAYYPTGNSFPGIVGEMLSAGLGSIGFSWIASPACTELEVSVMNWMGKMLAIPEEFLNCSDGPGGGVIQGSASEATLVGLLAARDRTIRRLKAENTTLTDGEIRAKLVAYTSDQSNSSVEKAGILAAIPMRLLPSDDKCRMRGATLEAAFAEDRAKGLIPCYVVSTLGTTGTCAFDPLEELGPICNRENVWLHVDAAYAGTAFSCPEYRHLMKGVELVDSFNFNPHKWMMVNFDVSAMWVKNSYDLIDAFNVDRIYLKHDHEDVAPDYRHWQIPLGRRFRALKVWMVMRIYGVEGIQNHVRKQCHLAEMFENYVRSNDHFEIVSEVSLGLVCFRMRGEDHRTKALLDRLMARKNIYIIVATYHGSLFMRFVVCARMTEPKDIDYAWQEISTQASAVLDEEKTRSVDIIEQLSLKTKATFNDIELPSLVASPAEKAQ